MWLLIEKSYIYPKFKYQFISPIVTDSGRIRNVHDHQAADTVVLFQLKQRKNKYSEECTDVHICIRGRLHRMHIFHSFSM